MSQIVMTISVSDVPKKNQEFSGGEVMNKSEYFKYIDTYRKKFPGKDYLCDKNLPRDVMEAGMSYDDDYRLVRGLR